MRKFIPLLLMMIISLFFILSGCILNPPLEPASSSLNKQHFKKTVTVDDHPSNTFVTFSTVKGVQEKQSTHNIVLNDNFLRGFFNKKTKAKTYQVYNVIYYAGSGSDSRWKSFEQANYQTPTGEKMTSTTVIEKNEDCEAIGLYGKCLYNEHVTFRVDEAWLRQIATSYAPRLSKKDVWRYVLIPKLGDNHKDKLLAAEVAGLLEKMDQYIRLMPSLRGEAPLKSGTTDPSLKPEPLLKKPLPAQDVLPIFKQ